MSEKTNADSNLTEKQQIFVTLYNQGLSDDQIADKMGISCNAVRNHRYKLRKRGLFSPVKHLKLHISNQRIMTEHERKLQDFITEHEALFDVSAKTSYVDLEQVKNVIGKLGFTYNDVRLLVNVYIEQQLYEEAISLLYEYEKNNTLSEDEYREIAYMKKDLRIKFANIFIKPIPGYMFDSGNISHDYDDYEL